jgi:DNA-binding transcriptional LysR family regulator
MTIEQSFRAAGAAFHCKMEIETTEALKRAVAEGLGCSLVSRWSIQTEIKTGILGCSRILGSPIKREFKAIMHKDKNVSGPLEPFLQLLKIKFDSQAANQAGTPNKTAN